ncbi:MAG: copper amine oxidase N-terminal domain-containing protein [Clostridia bacterium]|nr:copper amine oxidase N-terminal domain-containing protein [Clostridia bacterium]
MKRKQVLALLLTGMLLLSGTSVFAVAETIIINGAVATIPAEMGSIKEMDSRTFVPIRFVMEYLGCHVDFDDANMLATVSSDTCAYLIQEGNPVLFTVPYPDPEGETLSESISRTMDTVPFIDLEESRMYIPIRFLAEAIGYDVGWDGDTQTVTLTRN